MNISAQGVAYIKKKEGCILSVYVDCVGKKTLGYGHTGADVNAMSTGTKITQTVADACLQADLVKFENNVNKYNAKYKWTQNEYDALVSFAFNVGSIDQLTAKGTRTKPEIANYMLKYNRGGGKVIVGLTTRRKEEQAMFLYGNYGNVKQNSNDYKIGQTYTLDSNLYVREEPYGNKIKHTCLTANGKVNAYFDSYGNAILKQGTKVTCKDIKETATGSIWLMIPSGWICAKEQGKTYIK